MFNYKEVHLTTLFLQCASCTTKTLRDKPQKNRIWMRTLFEKKANLKHREFVCSWDFFACIMHLPCAISSNILLHELGVFRLSSLDAIEAQLVACFICFNPDADHMQTRQPKTRIDATTILSHVVLATAPQCASYAQQRSKEVAESQKNTNPKSFWANAPSQDYCIHSYIFIYIYWWSLFAGSRSCPGWSWFCFAFLCIKWCGWAVFLCLPRQFHQHIFIVGLGAITAYKRKAKQIFKRT